MSLQVTYQRSANALELPSESLAVGNEPMPRFGAFG